MQKRPYALLNTYNNNFVENLYNTNQSLFGKKRFMLDEKFQRNASKFAIYLCKPKVDFSIFHFVLCFIFSTSEYPGFCGDRGIHYTLPSGLSILAAPHC